MSLKEYYEVDQKGNRLDVHVLDDEVDDIPDNYVPGWGERVFYNPIYNFEFQDWVEAENLEGILEEEKRLKDEELNAATNEAIAAGFDHTINGVTYHFSFDTEAQLNYQGAERLLSKGTLTSIDFTVFRDGNYERIPITAEEMDKITIAILMHKNRNIVKYRELLLPLVQGAKTVEEVRAITWDSI